VAPMPRLSRRFRRQPITPSKPARANLIEQNHRAVERIVRAMARR
jgi:hypothetical protein